MSKKTIILLIVVVITSMLLCIDNSFKHLFLDNKDHFGCDIEISKQSNYNYPESKFPFNDSILSYTNLVLYTHSLGIYDFRFCSSFNTSGEIYLKAYEVTKNIRLTSDRLKTKSKIKVKKNQNLSCYMPEKNIIIYEGNGECKYVARFEVWFRKDGKVGDRKIFEKNYLITGWRR